MNKRTIITYIVLSLVLLGGILALIVCLYKDDAGKGSTLSEKDVISRYRVLETIPSDAAAVVHFDNAKTGLAALTDDTKAFSALTYDGKKGGMPSYLSQLCGLMGDGALSSLRSLPMALSLHYSGSIVPMAVFELPRSVGDSTAIVLNMRALADSNSLASAFHVSGQDHYLLVSSSETLVGSSVRHIDEGLSILSNKDFQSCAAKTKGSDAIFLSNTYSQKLLQTFFKKPVYRHSEFIKSLSEWISLSVDSMQDDVLNMSGVLSTGKNQDLFANVLSSQSVESALFPSVVPSGSCLAVSLPLNQVSGYLESYRKYLDAYSALSRNQSALSSLGKSVGVTPDSWAKSLNLKEVVKSQWRTPDGSSYEAVMVRVGKKDYSLIFKGLDVSNEKDYAFSVEEYAFPSYASTLFGDLFSVEDESCFVFTGEWIVSGSRDAVSDFASRFSAGDVLQALLSDASVNAAPLLKSCTFASFFSPGSGNLDELMTPSLLPAVNRTLDGAAFEPCFLTVSGQSIALNVTRVPFIEKSSTPAVVSDASIEVPSGPFKVQNSGTGRTNFLSQQSNFYLSLKDEDGKGIWSIPFSAPLCGAVESIDYYVNGKIQFLFAAGSKLYLLDRLGRFVSGFPVELGKEVLLGPAAYDFTGAHGYSVMVLHADNTIGMYNIHGAAPSEWKGISPDEKIIALPELIKAGGRSYWVVRTAVQTQIFPFYGGDPVYRQSGAKSIRRDSVIEVVGDGTVKATCNDGKTRNLKIQ